MTGLNTPPNPRLKDGIGGGVTPGIPFLATHFPFMGTGYTELSPGAPHFSPTYGRGGKQMDLFDLPPRKRWTLADFPFETKSKIKKGPSFADAWKTNGSWLPFEG